MKPLLSILDDPLFTRACNSDVTKERKRWSFAAGGMCGEGDPTMAVVFFPGALNLPLGRRRAPCNSMTPDLPLFLVFSAV